MRNPGTGNSGGNQLGDQGSSAINDLPFGVGDIEKELQTEITVACAKLMSVALVGVGLVYVVLKGEGY